MRVGDLVSLPDGALARYGVVEERQGIGRWVWASTGTTNYRLLMEESDLTVIGRLVLGDERGSAVSGNRNRTVQIVLQDGRYIAEIVRTRDGRDGSHETRAFAIRRIALEQLVRQWPEVAS